MPAYLDMAATTPVSGRVCDVVLTYMRDEFGNAGSRTHDWGNRAKKAVAAARAELATTLAAKPDELIFTSGATESDNIALLGLAAEGERTGRRHILSSATEHKAVLEPLEHLATRGFDVELLRPDATGRFAAQQVLERVRPDTLLVSLMHVNNETGVLQPVVELADALTKTATFLHVDAAQSYGKVAPDDLRAPIDMISISGHKIGAPKGIGALLVRRRGWAKVPLQPLLYGGGQERGLRPGTTPVALIMGLLEAARERHEELAQWTTATTRFRSHLLEVLSPLGMHLNGDPDHSAPHILNISFPHVDSEALIVALRDLAAIATGSACTSTSYTPSHVLSAMGLDKARIDGAIRLSWWGEPTTDLEGLRQAVAELQLAA
ncbi:cysteine desulfurase DndA [Kineococcus terrestris]|uniref:cysteine desulfurase DndA n=1 Tax=Kineococcus terrestris TaxID=2044856 RepID=UPI0034DB2FC0